MKIEKEGKMKKKKIINFHVQTVIRKKDQVRNQVKEQTLYLLGSTLRLVNLAGELPDDFEDEKKSSHS